ncbi:DUF1549 domain-containing protein [Lignipirellula cremea]|uniref:Planctomycete cytochrome C n=1 Tax=Lignipirellula cremea TaxID=2528010 RepID=A0A518DPV2_9BACT|nr:DUF1549 domain-containing protein [Lignipirellula cremea]QDU93867.1 Planctomycete cytochrome C [Lignipirellula cremea]
MLFALLPRRDIAVSLPLFVLLLALTIAGRASGAELDFAHQVAPILKQHCAACHAGKEAKGGFSINTRDGFLDDDRATPGKPDESLFLDLVSSTDEDIQMPPADKPRVSPAQIALLRRWVAEGMHWEPGFSFAPQTYEPPLRPRTPELPPVVDGRTNPIDRIVDANWEKQQIPRPQPLGDDAFLRRAYLDLIGLPPTPEEIAAFQADAAVDKRARLVRRLLDDEVRYTEHWLTFWNDLLRNDYAGTGFITGGRSQISNWLYQALIANKPYDELARELIAPTDAGSRGFINGIKWRGTVSAAQGLEVQFAQSVSQSFLGINMKCASCHDSFIDRWKLSEAYGLAAIYASGPLDLYRCDKPTGETATAAWLFPELGQIDAKASQPERLAQLAALMTHPENGRFTRTIVNRLWHQLMGRGIVHPVDAMQTPPWNDDLLDYLAVHLQEHDYDLKQTLELIATSQAYQSQAEVLDEENALGGYRFRGPRTKRMTAEQFVDAVWQITGTAPNSYDAPVTRGQIEPGEVASIPLQAQWIWGDSAAPPSTPPAGETLAMEKTFTVDQPIAAAAVLATCDNRFTLYVNGAQVAQSGEWQKPQAASLLGRIRQGENRLLVVAKNEGSGPNAAGLFVQVRLKYADGKSETIATDDSWQVASDLPDGDAKKWDLAKLAWKDAVIVEPLSVWTKAVKGTPRLLAQASTSTPHMVRASLLKSDFLMRSLGRPNRDQIVTSRPNELTTLEAIDLSNNQILARALVAGGQRFAAGPDRNTAERIRLLYQSVLTREPTAAEADLLRETLGEQPTAAAWEDVLWVLLMSPEFLLVR